MFITFSKLAMCMSSMPSDNLPIGFCLPPNHTLDFLTENCTMMLIHNEVDIRYEYHPVFDKFASDCSEEFNTSGQDFLNTIWIHRPTWEIVSKSVVFGPIIIAGIIGNVILLHVILSNRHLRAPTNLLIANMAAADLATLLICPWMFMCSDFFQNYILGEVGCKTEGFFECALLLTGVFNLCAVSYDRLTAIVLPLEARLSCRRAYIVMATTWSVGAVVSLPLIFYRHYKEREWANFYEMFCMEDVNVLPMYWHVIISLLVWFPLGVMAICYSAIFIKLDNYEQQVLRSGREHPATVNVKTKVARMLFIVVIVFITCRLPFTVFIFWRNQNIKNSSHSQSDSFFILWSMSHYIIFSNAAINPVIYGLTNDNFRRAFRTSKLSCWLFGPPPTTNHHVRRPPLEKVLVKDIEPQQNCIVEAKLTDKPKSWFTQPKPNHKMKTITTDCYM